LRADVIGRIFSPFITTKAHGLGIGLTIAQRIVDAHRGTIAANNSAEGGAIFAITLLRTEPGETPSDLRATVTGVSESPSVETSAER
jgi:signal transduction histidine kinase